jgi:iron-sulfur cluster assembly accessory protein
MTLAPRTSQREAVDPRQHEPVGPSAFDGDVARDGVRLTPMAIEMAKQALRKRGTPDASLRIGVRGGGCSGASYAIEFSDKVRARDNVYDFDGLRVVIDPKSLVYLRGCGESFSV